MSHLIIKYTDPRSGSYKTKVVDRVDFDRTTLRGYRGGEMVIDLSVHKVGSVEPYGDSGGGLGGML